MSFFKTSAPVFLPDIDLYFKQDIDAARVLIDRLSASGAKYVKGAVIQNADLCFDGDIQTSFLTESGVVSERYRSVIERHILPLKDTSKIYEYALLSDLDVVLTVYDYEGAVFAKDLGVSALKIASSCITHLPLIKFCAKLNTPLIIDTGRATMSEIAAAVEVANDSGVSSLLLQHSPPAPPNGVELHNLKMMRALGQTFGCEYGLSDHHDGNEMLIAATALGASVLEKGISSEGQCSDIDLFHTACISQIEKIITSISNVHLALGETYRQLDKSSFRHADRMGLVAATDIQMGDLLSETNVRFAFALPEGYIGTEDYEKALDSTVQVSIKKGEPITWNSISVL